MHKAATRLKKSSETSKSAAPAKNERVLEIPLERISRIDAKTKARLEPASRSPGNTQRDFPEVVVD